MAQDGLVDVFPITDRVGDSPDPPWGRIWSDCKMGGSTAAVELLLNVARLLT